MLCHLESHHGLDVSVAEVTCPLCLELTFSDRDALSLHLARHMEEISLAVVPLDYDSDDENANSTSSSSNSTTGASDSIVNRMVEDMEKELGTRCICGLEESPHADDLLIQCDTCKAWQHGGCVGIEDESLSPNEYFCEICRGDLHRILEGPLQGQRSVYQPVKEVIDARDDEKYRSRIKQLQMENEERSSRLRQLDQAVNHLREQIWDPQLQSASERILQEESFNLSYEDWVRSSMEDNFANVGFRAELRRLFEGHGVQNIELVQLKKEVTQLQRRKQREDMLKDGKEPGHEMDAGKSTTSNPVNTTPQFTVHTPSEFPSQSIDDTLERRNYMSVPGSNAPMRQISEDESSTGSRDNGVPDAYKRDEQPPQNSEGKMVCKYSDCVGICFDRKSEWR